MLHMNSYPFLICGKIFYLKNVGPMDMGEDEKIIQSINEYCVTQWLSLLYKTAMNNQLKQILILDFRSKPQKVSTNINKNIGFFRISIIFRNMQAVTTVQKTTNHSKRHPQKTWTETIIPNLIIASSRMLRRCIFFCFISQPRIIIRIKFYLFILTINKRLSHTICTVCVWFFFLCLVIRSKNKRYVKIIWNKFTKTNIQSKPVSTSFEVKIYNHCLHQLSVCFDNRIPFSLICLW